MRKTSQAALLVLLEQGLVDTNDVVEQVRVLEMIFDDNSDVSCVGVSCSHPADGGRQCG